MLALAAFVLASVSTGTFTPAGTADGARVPFERAAERWAESRGVTLDAATTVPKLFDEQFFTVRLGALDVLVPRDAFADEDQLPVVQDALGALLEVQASWVGWMQGASSLKKALPREVRKASEKIGEWIGELRTSDFDASMRGDLVDALAPKEKVRELFAAYEAYVVEHGGFGDERARLVLVPRRADFVEFAAVIGQLESHMRSWLWVAGLENWTHLDYDGLRVAALEFADPDAPGDYTRGLPMTFKNPRALAQHAAQLGARVLMEAAIGDALDPLVGAGLSNVLVIERYGQVDTRTDGDARSRKTDARSIFIPGGNPNGGVLPPIDANSRWRARLGAEYFAGELAGAMDEAEKEVEKKQRWRSFALHHESGGEKLIVQAPFLGPSGSDRAPAAEYMADYAEFLRAYRAAFFAWLREEAAGRKSKSVFAELMARWGDQAQDSLPGLLTELYGAPLSSPELDGEELEAEFLRWLAKQG